MDLLGILIVKALAYVWPSKRGRDDLGEAMLASNDAGQFGPDVAVHARIGLEITGAGDDERAALHRLWDAMGAPADDAELATARARRERLEWEHGPGYHGFGNPPRRRPRPGRRAPRSS